MMWLVVPLATLVVVAFPSFFFQRYGKGFCSGMTYLTGGMLGLAIFIQEPLLLALNPTLAILGISLNSIQKTKLND